MDAIPTRITALVAASAAAALLVAAPPAQASTPVELTLLATNDFHRQLAPVTDTAGNAVGGAAWLATHLDRVRQRAPDALHVDAGDLTGAGSNGFGLPGGYADEATVEVMDVMGLAVTTVGNHEFDAGLTELRRVREGGCWLDCGYRHDVPWPGAAFTTLASNVLDAATGDTVFAPWTILEAQGVQVGVVGATGTDLVDANGYGDVTTSPPFDAVNASAAAADEAGADVVVVLLHSGSHLDATAPGDGNGCTSPTGPSTWMLPWFHEAVDAVVDGHTHVPYVCDFAGMPLLTQAGARGTSFTEITLTYDPASGTVVDRAAVNRVVSHDVAPDPEVTAVLDAYRASMARVAPPSADLDGDTLGDAYEVVRTGTDPRRADTDGDGVDDAAELDAGTSPTDPTSVPVVKRGPTKTSSDGTGGGGGKGRWSR